MAPTPQQLLLIAQAKRKRAEAGEAVDGATVEPMGGQGEWDLSKFEAIAPQVVQTKPLPASINAPNPITTAVRQSQVQAGNQWQQGKVAEQARQAQASRDRKEAAAAFGGGMDLMPTIDESGNVRPGSPSDQDIGKGVVSAPIRLQRGAVMGAESVANLPGDIARGTGADMRQANMTQAYLGPSQGIDPNIFFGQQAPRTAEDDAKYQAALNATPRFDFSGAEIPVPQELDSLTGYLTEGLAQFLVARKLIGTAAPGGGTGAQLGKDFLGTFTGYDGRTGRLSDSIDSNAVPEGPLRQYLDFLKSQPDDSPLVGRFKNTLEDMTMSGPALAPHTVVRGGQMAASAVDRALTRAPMTPTNAGGARLGLPAPTPTPRQAATPPSAPVAPVAQAPIPQAAPRPAQAAAPGAGQGGGAVPPAGGPPVLNAAPVAPQGAQALAKSDARIIGRLLRAGGVPSNDVNRTLTGLVQAYQSSNSSRLPLAFFAEDYLPTVLPKEVADDVIQKLRGFGRERFSANKPGDPSRSTMRGTIDELRSTQQDNLSGVMDANLYKGKLIGQEDKLNKELEANARIAYNTALDNGRNRLVSARATQEERDAFGNLQSLLKNPAFLKEVPQHLRIKAMREGIDIEDFVQKDPIGSAHWLQSELRQAVDAAEGVGGTSTSESRLYGEMRQALIDDLEKAVPGYRGARKEHGDIYGAKEAIDFGQSFMKSARSEVETARLARQFAKLSKRQKTAATMSIRDALKNEFRNKAEDTAAKVTRLQQAGVLDGLEQVLGADGKRVADAIRNTVKENDRLRAIDQLSNSQTKDNFSGAEAAQAAVRSPVNKAIKETADKSNLLYTAGIDAALMANGMPPVVTASALAGRVADRFGNPSAKKLASATKTLYGLPSPPSNALAPPRVAGPPRAPRPKTVATQETLDDLLKQYDAIDHAKQPEKAQATLRKITNLKKKLNAQGQSNALSAPPKPPVKPEKAGFGGSSKQLDMSPAAVKQRAREQGFDVETPYYHGTYNANGLDEFDLGRAGGQSGSGEGAIFLSDSPKRANSYSEPAMARLQEPTPEQWDRSKKVFGYTDDQLRDRMNRDAPTPGVFKTYVRGPVRDVDWVEYTGSRKLDDQAMKRLIAEERRGAGRNIRVRNMDDGGGDASATTMVVLDPRNIRSTTAAFDPSQSRSSKLLAGFAGNPEAVGAAAGGVGGYVFNPTDANQDGVIDDKDRLLNAAGGAFGTAVATGMARSAGRAIRGPRKPGPPVIESPQFKTRDGTTFAVHFDDTPQGTSVSFNANSGPRAPKNALKDEFRPTGGKSLQDANETFAGVEKAIREDIATNARDRYIFEGRTQRQRDLYAQMAARRKPPEGYAWEAGDNSVALVKRNPEADNYWLQHETMDLPKEARVFGPGKPDDLGFITAAENALANPPARFRDAQRLTADQWRKYMREAGASNESFKWQIEPALKKLEAEGFTGDIPKAKLEEALAKERGTLKMTNGTDGVAAPLADHLVQNYGQYVAPGSHSNYQQHVLALPEHQGQGYKSHNWSHTKNPVGHIRTTNRISANGEKVLHVEELQSDLHQEGAQYGYRGENAITPQQVQKLADTAKAADRRYNEWVVGARAGTKPDEAEGRELLREATEARKRYEEAAVGQRNAPPRAPLENWEDPFIRYALKQGADQGVDVVTFPTHGTLHKALKNEGTQKFYDQRLPNHLAKVAKSLGVQVEQVDVPIARIDAGQFAPVPTGNNFAVVNKRSGKYVAENIVTLDGAKRFAASLNTKTQPVPAIRLTPEAKARLKSGVIMDAKDPGRVGAPKQQVARKPASPPNTQTPIVSNGFGGKGPGGFTDTLVDAYGNIKRGLLPNDPRHLNSAAEALQGMTPVERTLIERNAAQATPVSAMEAGNTPASLAELVGRATSQNAGGADKPMDAAAKAYQTRLADQILGGQRAERDMINADKAAGPIGPMEKAILQSYDWTPAREAQQEAALAALIAEGSKPGGGIPQNAGALDRFRQGTSQGAQQPPLMISPRDENRIADLIFNPANARDAAHVMNSPVKPWVSDLERKAIQVGVPATGLAALIAGGTSLYNQPGGEASGDASQTPPVPGSGPDSPIYTVPDRMVGTSNPAEPPPELNGFIKDTRIRAQQRLMALGYAPQNLKPGVRFDDGVDGEATRAAVMRFQRENNLPVTGDLDPMTLRALWGGKNYGLSPVMRSYGEELAPAPQ